MAEYYKEYSSALGRDMEYKVYGWGGVPCIYFPCQNGRFYDFENFGVVDVCRDFLRQGRIQIYTVDSVDNESLSAEWKSGWERIERQEQYYRYITRELVPLIQKKNERAARDGIIVIGFSMGAYHSANFYFRRPDIFTGNLSLSGVYNIGFMIGDFHNNETYLNSPIDSLRNLPENHEYYKYFKKNKAIFCVGQGAWEHPMQESTRELDTILCQKGIPAEFHYWGYDVAHDWYWWKKQLASYLPVLLFRQQQKE